MAFGAALAGFAGGALGGYLGTRIANRPLRNDIRDLNNRLDNHYAGVQGLGHTVNYGNNLNHRLSNLGLYQTPYQPQLYAQPPVYAPPVYNNVPIYNNTPVYNNAPVYYNAPLPQQQLPNTLFGPNQQVFISNGDQNFVANGQGGYSLLPPQQPLPPYQPPQQIFIANGNQNFYDSFTPQPMPHPGYHHHHDHHVAQTIPWPPQTVPSNFASLAPRVNLQIYS